jgi:hypothetical protein
MPEEKAPEQTSKPARRVSPPPATERPTCDPVCSNETFARKVEAAKHLFLKELQKRYSDTSHEALWLGKPIQEREKRDRELEPLLISWLESSVQCLEKWFWELHNIAVTSSGGPKDSAAHWAGQAAGEVVRGYFKFEKEINAVEPNTIFWWWRFSTEHADGRVSQDVPERWNTNFSSRIEHVFESLVNHAVLGIRGPSLARTMAGPNDLSRLGRIGTPSNTDLELHQELAKILPNGKLPEFEIVWERVHPSLDANYLRLRILQLQRRAREGNKADWDRVAVNEEYLLETESKYAKAILNGAYTTCLENCARDGIAITPAVLNSIRENLLQPLRSRIVAQWAWAYHSYRVQYRSQWNWLADPDKSFAVFSRFVAYDLKHIQETLNIDIEIAILALKSPPAATRNIQDVQDSAAAQAKAIPASSKSPSGATKTPANIDFSDLDARLAAVESYRADYLAQTGKRLTNKDIYTAAGYSDRSQLEDWLNGKKCSAEASAKFAGVIFRRPHLPYIN